MPALVYAAAGWRRHRPFWKHLFSTGEGVARVPSDLPAGDVTFLFSDVEASTSLLRDLGDEGFAALLVELRGAHSSAAEAAGGVVLGLEGDSAFLSFRSPGNAVQAAVAVQGWLAARRGSAVRVRMGLHRGRNIRPVDGNYSTLAVHQAARVMAAANGGQVLVTSEVAEAVPERCRSFGLFAVRDFEEPVELFGVRDAGDREAAPPRALQLGTGSFPSFRTRFLGRRTEREALRAALADTRLVTLVGPGGAGKTRLAVETVAESDVFAARWFVDLTAVGPAAVEGAVRRALSEVAGADDDPAESLRDVLAGRPAVLVLDNCEHVLDAAAYAADRLLSGCPSLHVLGTSREPLGLPDERLVSIKGLDLPESEAPSAVLASAAGQLFWDRAAQVSERALDESTAAAVRGLVQELDGLPLALELVAAMSWAYSTAELRHVVHEQLVRATAGDVPAARGRPARHSTLSAVVDWSVHQLKPEAVDALVALSFATPPIADRTAAAALQAIGVTAERAVTLLEHLTRRSLLTRVVEDSSWRLLESVRTYCHGHDHAAAVRGVVVPALAADCIAAIEEVRSLSEAAPAGLDAVAPTAVALLDVDVLPVPVRQELALRLAPWFLRMGNAALASHCEAALAMGVPDRHVGLGLHCLAATTYVSAGVPDRAERHLSQAEPLVPTDPRHPDSTTYIRALALLGVRRGDVAGVRLMLEQRLPLVDEEDRITLLGMMLTAKAVSRDYSGAISDAEELMRLSPRPSLQLNLANAHAWQGNVRPALSHVLAYLDGARNHGERAMAAHVAATALTHERRWSVETYALLLWAHAGVADFGFEPFSGEAEDMHKQLSRAETELSTLDHDAAAARAAELDDLSVHELIKVLAARRLEEANGDG